MSQHAKACDIGCHAIRSMSIATQHIAAELTKQRRIVMRSRLSPKIRFARLPALCPDDGPFVRQRADRWKNSASPTPSLRRRRPPSGPPKNWASTPSMASTSTWCLLVGAPLAVTALVSGETPIVHAGASAVVTSNLQGSGAVLGCRRRQSLSLRAFRHRRDQTRGRPKRQEIRREPHRQRGQRRSHHSA